MNRDDALVLTRRNFVSLAAAVPVAAAASSAHASDSKRNVVSNRRAAFVTAALEVGVRPADDATARSWVNTEQQFAEQVRFAHATGIGSLLISLDAAPTRDVLFRNWLRLQRWVSATEAATLQSNAEPAAMGRVGVVACLRDTQRFAAQLDDLADFRASGIAVMGLACDWKGAYGDGALERSDLSLTALGAKAVKRMNGERIVIDLARMGRRGSLEVMASSSHPVIFSHTNAAALQEHPLNATDEQIKACAARGGVIGIGHSPLPASNEQRVQVEQTVRHIEHVIQLVGIDHVGLAVLEIEPVVTRLRARGLTDQQVAQVSGENFRRVFQQVSQSVSAGNAA
ncbi:dipeptidase [Steroidobacter sp.]|uniref:dipeptidase n=1 Tax=Steroidobacter sp. TaxID=1978227 RepID=UPI001A609ED5|nr:membrane dipeptidase [Steroidobacter sp.]MBL8271336.1 membrane dipeptidase [Steroidobacter sp.]